MDKEQMQKLGMPALNHELCKAAFAVFCEKTEGVEAEFLLTQILYTKDFRSPLVEVMRAKRLQIKQVYRVRPVTIRALKLLLMMKMVRLNKGRLVLMDNAITTLPVWLDREIVETLKADMKRRGVPYLHHRIQWEQQRAYLEEGIRIKTPVITWLSKELRVVRR